MLGCAGTGSSAWLPQKRFVNDKVSNTAPELMTVAVGKTASNPDFK